MMRIGTCALCLVIVGCSQDAAAPRPAAWFAEEAAARGIDFQHRSGFDKGTPEQLPLLPEIVAGGAALFDADGDGDLDAYLVQSGFRLDAADSPRPGNALYLNRGDGTFDKTGASGETGYGMGVAVGDYDDDGDIDLYITNVGPNALLRNDGHGVFEDVAAAAGVAHPGWGTAAAFLDFDADDDLDLFVVNYMDWSLAIERDCHSRGRPTYCAPTTYRAPAMDRLFRNDGDGTFTDVTLEAGLNRAFGNGLGLAAADFDGDGLLDVFVANDKMVNQLWLNRGDMRFDEVAALWGCAVDDHGAAKAGMGVAAADVDDDGDVDLLVVNLKGETDSYFRNDGGYFADATASVGLSAASRRHTRFGVALGDFDNDGALDLYEANGKVDGDVHARPDAFAEPNTAFRGTLGAKARFIEKMPPGGVAEPLVHTSRAVAMGDVDGDGGIDLLVANRDAAPYLLMNRVASRGDSVRFRVLTGAGRDAHGALVSARIGGRRLQRAVQPASSYLASHEPVAHFGLGAVRAAADVLVTWPGGHREAFGDFPVPASGETIVLRRGAGKQAP